MFNGQKIKDIIAERGYTQKEVFNRANIKSGTFYSLFNENANPSSNIIESIADVLNCNIDDFFDRKVESKQVSIGHQVNGNGNSVSGDISLAECKRELNHLKQLLEEKERLIQVLLNK